MAIYTIVIAAVWQTSGFVMAIFLAGLRGIDNEIIKAAQIDGASNLKLYARIIIPQLRPAFLSAFVVLAHMAIKSYDLVVALTGGGPGAGDRDAGHLHVLLHPSRATRWASAPGSAVIMLMMVAADHRALPLCRAAGAASWPLAPWRPPSARAGSRGR